METRGSLLNEFIEKYMCGTSKAGKAQAVRRFESIAAIRFLTARPVAFAKEDCCNTLSMFP